MIDFLNRILSNFMFNKIKKISDFILIVIHQNKTQEQSYLFSMD